MVTSGSRFGFSNLTAGIGFFGGGAVLFSATEATGMASAGFDAAPGGAIFDLALGFAAVTLTDFGFLGAADVLGDLRGSGFAGTAGVDAAAGSAGAAGAFTFFEGAGVFCFFAASSIFFPAFFFMILWTISNHPPK